MPLTAQQICQIARERAKCPNYTVQSGYALNSFLQELCETYDFAAARGTFNGTFVSATTQVNNLNTAVASGPFELPADYLRAKRGDVYYFPQGYINLPYYLVPIDIEEFDGLIQQAGFQNFPVYWVTDMSVQPPIAYVWPPAGGAYPFMVRYSRKMPDIVNPETSGDFPWFI